MDELKRKVIGRANSEAHSLRTKGWMLSMPKDLDESRRERREEMSLSKNLIELRVERLEGKGEEDDKVDRSDSMEKTEPNWTLSAFAMDVVSVRRSPFDALIAEIWELIALRCFTYEKSRRGSLSKASRRSYDVIDEFIFCCNCLLIFLKLQTALDPTAQPDRRQA